ncbi:MAG: DUF5305 domain-containing protein [Clostridiales bacterium]|jgi:hypothetical protein|nr:DUF5305 domain-containing protein [Clostridiales bacterium]
MFSNMIRAIQAARQKRSFGQRLITYVVGTLALLLLTVTLLMLAAPPKKMVTLAHTETSAVDYKVYLKDNDYYATDYLDSGMHYITELIDHVYILYDYTFTADTPVAYDARYVIDAQLTVFEKGKRSSIIFTESERLVEDGVLNGTAESEFRLTRALAVDYARYNDRAAAFKATYNLTADAVVEFILCIQTDGRYIEAAHDVTVDNRLTVIVPLNEQMIDITPAYRATVSETESVCLAGGCNTIFLICGLFALVAFLVIGISGGYIMYDCKHPKTDYERAVHKILRGFARVVVESKEPIAVKAGDEVIELVTITELVDVADRLSRPVFCHELEKGRKMLFAIKNGNEIYRFVLEA